MSAKTLLWLAVSLLLALPVWAEPVNAPGSLNVPPSDSDGNYNVMWAASPTSGAQYVLEEAATPDFNGSQVVYTGKATKVSLKRHLAGNVYYYRVKATLANYEDSIWSVGDNGCAVPYRVKVKSTKGGTITPSGLVEIPVGTTRTIVITPETGYHVASVLVDGVERGEVLSVMLPDALMESPKNKHAIKAKFAINSYQVATSAVGGGTIKPAGTKIIKHGKVVKYTVTPDQGQKIASLLVNGVAQSGTPSSGPFTFSLSITEATTVIASFASTGAPPLTRQAINSNVELLPQQFLSSNQLRVSLRGDNGTIVFTDSSDAPLKKQEVAGSPPIPLANRFGSAENVVLFGGSLYWIEGGSLRRLTPGGGTIHLATGRRGAGADVTADIVVDDNYVYWVDQSASQLCSPPCNWEIQRIPVSGGTPVVLATASRRIDSLKADAANLYWEESSLEPWEPGCNCGSQIKTVAKTGGAATVLVDGSLNGTIPEPTPGSMAGSWLPTGGIAVTDTHVIFATASNSSYVVKSIPVTGGAISDLASITSNAGFTRNAILDLTVDGASIFWIDTANSTLNRMPVAGGNVVILADGLSAPAALATNGTTVFWTEAGISGGCCQQMGSGTIRQMSLGGGVASTIAENLDRPQELTVDDTRLVWSEMWRIAGMPAGGPIATLVSGIASDLARITIARSNVYILDGDLIKVVPLAGGTVEKFASARFGSIGDFSFADGDITADDMAVFWTVHPVLGETVVQKQALDGGAPVIISNGPALPAPQDCYWRIALDSQYVYWSDGSATHPIGCAVKRVPHNGGTVTTLVDQAYFADFTVDGVNLYFSEFEGLTPSIQRMSVSGGAASSMADNVAALVLTNDRDNLYWLDLQRDSLGAISKTGGGMTDVDWLTPNDLIMDPSLILEGLHVNDDGIFYSESTTGTIYRIY